MGASWRIGVNPDERTKLVSAAVLTALVAAVQLQPPARHPRRSHTCGDRGLLLWTTAWC